MKTSDILFLLIFGYAVIVKSSHLATAIKGKIPEELKVNYFYYH